MSTAQTILALLQGCNSLRRLKAIRARVFLLHFCAVSVSGCLVYARTLFDLIECLPRLELHLQRLRRRRIPSGGPLYYNGMLGSPFSCPDGYSFSFALKACERVGDEWRCGEIHGTMIRSGYEVDVMVYTNLTRCYAGNGLAEVAQKAFEGMSERVLVSWNSMISCYSQAGLHHEALGLYRRMRKGNVDVDGFTLVGLLSCCVPVGALNTGVELHRRASREGLLGGIFMLQMLLSTCMGNVTGLLRPIITWKIPSNGMSKRGVFTWNYVINAYGVNACADEAIFFFRQILREGLVDKGVEFFHMMSSTFNLKPEIKHYGCMVDLYGHAGKLEKALKIIGTSPFQVDPVIWRTLLSSCKIHQNAHIGEIATKNLVQLGACNAGDCILLVTIYAECDDKQGVLQE
ncbi:hypothetical protein ACJRO7_016495 [Eucalyptus globulus]|uniref:Pentatricopeptide repeat-containing protein n=1 Tax=Eucalyptus globulus TaxID=34317 RepID=A0ABD3L7I9_EUCGL